MDHLEAAELKAAGMKLEGYTLECRLGSGRFGTVYRARDSEGRQVAVKCSQHASQAVSADEVKTLKHLSHHDHVVAVYDLIQSPDHAALCLVMEYCTAGDLNAFLLQHRPSLQDKLCYMLDMARGVNHLHGQRVIHRDLKPQNVLVTEGPDRFVCKISDFGTAKIQSRSDGLFSTHCGTPAFQAPEVELGKYTYSADVFSLGSIYFTMVAGTVVRSGDESVYAPFLEVAGEQLPLTAVVRRSTLDPEDFAEKHFRSCPALGHLVCDMVRLEPGKRPLMDLLLVSLAEIKGSRLAGRSSSTRGGLVQKLQQLEKLLSADKTQTGLGTFQDDAAQGHIPAVSIIRFLTQEELVEFQETQEAGSSESMACGLHSFGSDVRKS